MSSSICPAAPKKVLKTQSYEIDNNDVIYRHSANRFNVTKQVRFDANAIARKSKRKSFKNLTWAPAFNRYQRSMCININNDELSSLVNHPIFDISFRSSVLDAPRKAINTHGIEQNVDDNNVIDNNISRRLSYDD